MDRKKAAGLEYNNETRFMRFQRYQDQMHLTESALEPFPLLNTSL